jgi:nitroreductase
LDVLQAVFRRRSVKYFDGSYRMPEEDETKLLEATIQSPTSFNVQHWRFVILRDSELRSRIRHEFAGGQAQITDASLLVLFTADVKSWEKAPERYWHNTTDDVRGRLVGAIGPFHIARGDEYQRDEAHWSIGMAMQTLMLAAQELGYESCPMIGYNLEEVAKLVNLPEDHVMGPMVAIGKGIKDPWPKPGQLPLNEVVFEDRF